MVLFDGEGKAYVGVEHGKRPQISAEDKQRLAQIAQRHGAFFEGGGGDANIIDALPRSAYRGSWDDMMQRQIKGYPPEFLYTIFTNTEVNNQAKSLTAPSKTIFDSILLAQDKVSSLKGRNFDADTLRKFLQSASQGDVDLLEMASQKATSENVGKFLASGERLMWPDDWNKYPNNAGKIAKKVNNQRQEFLASQKSGVFVVGSDHIEALKKLRNMKLSESAKPRQAKRPLMIGVGAD